MYVQTESVLKRTPEQKRPLSGTKKPNPKKPKSKKMPIRKRKNVNITLSPEAREMGATLAEDRGVPFARLVEELLRRELRKVGLLKPEGFSGEAGARSAG